MFHRITEKTPPLFRTPTRRLTLENIVPHIHVLWCRDGADERDRFLQDRERGLMTILWQDERTWDIKLQRNGVLDQIYTLKAEHQSVKTGADSFAGYKRSLSPGPLPCMTPDRRYLQELLVLLLQSNRACLAGGLGHQPKLIA